MNGKRQSLGKYTLNGTLSSKYAFDSNRAFNIYDVTRCLSQGKERSLVPVFAWDVCNDNENEITISIHGIREAWRESHIEHIFWDTPCFDDESPYITPRIASASIPLEVNASFISDECLLAIAGTLCIYITSFYADLRFHNAMQTPRKKVAKNTKRIHDLKGKTEKAKHSPLACSTVYDKDGRYVFELWMTLESDLARTNDEVLSKMACNLYYSLTQMSQEFARISQRSHFKGGKSE